MLCSLWLPPLQQYISLISQSSLPLVSTFAEYSGLKRRSLYPYLLIYFPGCLSNLKNYHPDLKIAPCAGSAVSAVVQGLTQESCAPSVTALESCACTQDKNSAAVVGSISTYVLNYCGSTAAEDVTSADKVFGAYCNQATPAAVPTGGPVTQYITDLPAYSELGGCGQSALSYAVQSLTDTNCPPAASLLVSTSVGPCPRSNSSASNLTQTGKLCLQQRPKCPFHQRTN